MTKCGIICTCVIIIIAMAALVICSVRGEKGGKPSQSLRDSSPKGGAKKGTKTVPGTPYEPGPLVFRTMENRIVKCSAATDLRRGCMVGSPGMERGEEWSRTLLYAKKELACVLAEQALQAGGIRFRLTDGELRAEMIAVKQENGGKQER